MATNETNGPDKRPLLLSILCILSFVGAGVLIIVLLATGVLVGVATGVSGLDSGVGGEWLHFILIFVSVVIALIGVIKMWKLKRTGFYLYVAGVGSVFAAQQLLASGSGMVGWVAACASIALYALFLGRFK
jgi:hypothetical protein